MICLSRVVNLCHDYGFFGFVCLLSGSICKNLMVAFWIPVLIAPSVPLLSIRPVPVTIGTFWALWPKALSQAVGLIIKIA